MTIHFSKYQGTGNDFIMIDDLANTHQLNASIIKRLCDRRMGIGADGVILIRNHSELDFEMVYYNADGSQSLCGNGSRCAVNFAKKLGLVKNTAHFLTIDGAYTATVTNQIVSLEMKDIDEVAKKESAYFVHNGSPHHIIFKQSNSNIDIQTEGQQIRHSEEYLPEGTNVNFVEIIDQHTIFVRTFERGVEDETLSCGTGVAASSLAASFNNIKSPITVQTLGGNLIVSFNKSDTGSFQNIILSGPAIEVFSGSTHV